MHVDADVEKKPDGFRQKISELKEAVRTISFWMTFIEILDDFKAVNVEGWVHHHHDHARHELAVHADRIVLVKDGLLAEGFN